MDDVEDDSQLRRGIPGRSLSSNTFSFFPFLTKPTHLPFIPSSLLPSSLRHLDNLSLSVAHKIYGIPQTINTANYVYFLAYQELFQFRRRKIAGRSRAGTGISLGAAGSSSIEGMDGKGKAKEDRSLKFPETIDGTMGRTGKQRDGKEEDVDLDGDENMDGERNGLNVDELGQEVFLDEIITGKSTSALGPTAREKSPRELLGNSDFKV